MALLKTLIPQLPSPVALAATLHNARLAENPDRAQRRRDQRATWEPHLHAAGDNRPARPRRERRAAWRKSRKA